MKDIKGAGGGEKAHKAIEARDTLRSKQIASVIDVLCEGPIQGLSNELKSIYLNETPIVNAAGEANFTTLALQWRLGTQDQAPADGFPEVEAETVLSAEVLHATPIVGHLNNPTFNRVRVTVSVPTLTSYLENGDVVGYQVTLAIYIQADSAGYPLVAQVTDTIAGKCVTGYRKSYDIALPASDTGQWDIKVVRVSEDSISVKQQNAIVFESYTGIVDAKLSYPNTAYVATRFDATQFSSVPARAFGIKGLIVQVPTNYTPASRDAVTGVWTPAVYDGVWDGTFKPAWTNNPAWCFYDLLLSDRYGLGRFVTPESVDKWNLYTISKYCDAMVPTGFGETLEPRFTCNLYLQSREDAYKVVQNVASIFRAISYWGSNTIVTMQDCPQDPIALFTNANVIDGGFDYTGTSAKQRHTVALISWNDPDDMYRQKVEYVQDADAIARLGVVDTELVAFGCTSRGQAHRMGKWLLATEQMATEGITFKVALDGCGVYPGAIISTSDVTRAQARMGGRIVDITPTTVTLDSDVSVDPGQTYSIRIALPEDKIDENGNTTNLPLIANYTVTSDVGVHRTLEIEPIGDAPATLPLKNAVFIFAASDINPETWRVLNVKESSPGVVEIGALAHVPGLFDFVEYGIEFEIPPISNVKAVPAAPTGVFVTLSRYLIGGQLVGVRASLGWVSNAGRFVITWRRADGVWSSMEAYSPSADIDNIVLGPYEFTVTAVSPIGMRSIATEYNVTLDEAMLGSAVLPPFDPLYPMDPMRPFLEAPFVGLAATVCWHPLQGAVGYSVSMGNYVPGVPHTYFTHRTIDVGNTLRFTYSAEDMVHDGGPWRDIFFRISAYGALGAAGATNSELLCTNSQLSALTGVRFSSGVGCIYFFCDTPVDTDFNGVNIYLTAEEGFTADETNLVYSGPGTNITIAADAAGVPLVAGVDYYLRVAGFDAFSKTGLTLSTEFTVQSVSLDITDLSSIGAFAVAPDPELYPVNTIYTNSVNGNAYVLTMIAGVKTWVIFVLRGSAADSPITGFLSNESVTIATDNTGFIADIGVSADGVFRVFNGLEEVSGVTVAYSVVSEIGVDIEINGEGEYTVTSMSADTGTAVLRATYTEVTIDKVYSIAKSKAGPAGEPASLVTLQTTAQTMKYSGLNVATPTPQSITLTAKIDNIPAGATVFTFVRHDAVGAIIGTTQTLVGTGDTRTFTDTDMSVAAFVRITATRGAFSDTTTITKIQDGASAAAVTITTSSQVFNVSKLGVATPGSVTLTANLQNTSGTINWSVVGSGWSLSSPTGPTVTLAYQALGSVTAQVNATCNGLTDVMTITKLTDGSDSITALLTNEAQLLSASAAGVIASYALATGTYMLYEGTTNVSSLAVYEFIAASSTAGITAAINSAGVYTLSNGMSSVDSAVAVFRATYKGVSYDKTFSVAKSKIGVTGTAGANGVDAAQITVTPSSQIFKVSDLGVATPSSVSLTAALQGASGTINWSISGAGWSLSASTGATVSLAYQAAGSTSVQITATCGSISDVVTIIKVLDGADAVFAVLTNEAQLIPASAAGVVSSYALAAGNMKVYKGSLDITASCIFSFVAGSSTAGITAAINSAGAYSLSNGMAAIDSAVASFRATYLGVSFDKVFSVSKSRVGASGEDGAEARSIRIKATSQVFATSKAGVVSPASISITSTQQNISGNPTFTIVSGSTTGISFPVVGETGFTLAPGNITSSNGSITVRVTASVGGLTDDVTICKLFDGTDAVSGYLTNESVVLPANSAGVVSSYTGASGVFKVFQGITDVTATAVFGNNSASNMTAASPTAGTGAYNVTSGVGDATDTASIVYTATYAGVTISKKFTITKARTGVIGDTGPVGNSARICYTKVTGSSLNPTPATSTSSGGAGSFPTLGTWGETVAWTATAPAITAGFSVFQSDGILNNATGVTTWNVPYLSNLKVGTLEAITANTGALTVSTSIKSGTAEPSGTTMTGAGMKVLSSGNFVMGNSSGNVAYNGLKLYMNGPTVIGGSIDINSGQFKVLDTGSVFAYNFLGVVARCENVSNPSQPGLRVTAWGGLAAALPALRSTGGAGTNPTVSIEAISSGTAKTITATTTGSGDAVTGSSSTGYDFYAAGAGTNYGPFTGAHDVLWPNDVTMDEGDIVVDVECMARGGISNTLFRVEKSSMPYQSGVIGIVNRSLGSLSSTLPAVFILGKEKVVDSYPGEEDTIEYVDVISDRYHELKNEYQRGTVNSIGEGQMNVCGENGNFCIGDVIVASSMPGKGMRADPGMAITFDSYGRIVAKARENCVFEYPGEVKRIACTYHCG